MIWYPTNVERFDHTELREDDPNFVEEEADPGQLLSDPHHLRKDCQMIAQAVKDRWPIAEEKRLRLIDRLLEIADSNKERHVLSAARALMSMDRDNVAAGSAPTAQSLAAQQTNIYVGTGKNPIDELHEQIEQTKVILPAGMEPD